MNELSTEWYKLILLTLIAVMLIIRTGGLSFFFRVFMRVFNLSYDSHTLKKTESTAFDLQLFKALEGINVKNASDAKFIRDQINKGVLKKQGFICSTPYGFIGDKKKGWGFYIFFALSIVIFFGTSIYSNHIANTHKLGYYLVEAMDRQEYVSLSNVTDKDENMFIDKNSCENFLSHGYDFSIRTASCSLLINSQGNERLWLEKKIEKSDLEFRLFYWGSVIYCVLAIYLSIGLFTFATMNREILKIKASL